MKVDSVRTLARDRLITLDAESVRYKDDNGFLHIDSSHITKEQVVGYYGAEMSPDLEPDKLYYAYRPADELIKAASSFNGVPILFEHHYESAENPCKEFRVGSTGTDAVFNAPYLDNSLHITDSVAIAAIESGEYRELSCAYSHDIDWTPGEFEGQKYDFVMRNIRGNHVALVSEGRAGHDVRVADSAIKQIAAEEPQKEESIMNKIEELLAKIVALLGSGAHDEEETPEAAPPTEEAATNVEETAAETVGDNDELEALLKAVGNEELEAALRAYITKICASGNATEEPTADTEAETPAESTDEETPTECAADSKQAADAIASMMKEVAKFAERRVRQDMLAKYAAAQDCAPLVGNIVNPLEYDSAEAIYKIALDAKGVDTSKHPASAYKSMVAVFKANDSIATPVTFRAANDGKKSDQAEAFEHLKNIRRA